MPLYRFDLYKHNRFFNETKRQPPLKSQNRFSFRSLFFDLLNFAFCLFSLMPFLAIGHPLKIEFLCSSGTLFTKAFLSKFFAYF